MDTITATWIAGPDAGLTSTLGPGSYFVGRAATCHLRSDDPDLDGHHLQIEVADGHARMTPLAGAVTPAETSPELPVALRLGASLLHLVAAGEHGDQPGGGAYGHHHAAGEHGDQPGGGQPAEPAHVRRGQLLRTPRPPRPAPPAAVAVPPEPDPPVRRTTGLAPAAVGLLGAGVVAMLLHQPMFLIFAAVGASVAVASWVAQVIGERRGARRRAADAAVAVAAFTAALDGHHRALLAAHRATTVTLPRAVRAITTPSTELWQRRSVNSDCLTISLGVGPLTVQATLDGSLAPGDIRATHTFPDEDVALDLWPGRCVGVRGEPGPVHAVARSIAIQAMSAAGPADLRVVVVTDQPHRWRWLESAPHAALPCGTTIGRAAALTDTVATLSASGTARIVILTDQPELLSSRTSPVRRAMTAGTPTVIALIPADHGIPDACTAAVTIGQHGQARWCPSIDDPFSVPVHVCGISALRAGGLVDRMARLDDPDDPLGADGRLPVDVAFTELLTRAGADPTCPTAIAAGWLAAGADPRLTTPIGVATDGTVDIDLVHDGPHALVAGTTGAGKSELLRSLVIGWAALSSPEHLAFVLIDYKGGATFDACLALPHVTGVITDLDDHLADRALRSLRAELRRREAVLRHHGASDLTELRAITGTARLPRLVVVVDEFAALVAEQPAFLHALVGIAQRGRSLGIHLVLATQRPRGVISDEIRANTTLRIALRLLDRDDAQDVVGDTAPATFPRATPGRAMLRLSDDEHVVFQTSHDRDGTSFRAAAAAIAEAAMLVGARQPPAPWQPPLPDVLDALHGGALGWIDDPDAQHIEELSWGPGDGSVLVAGRRGAGVTSALHTFAAAALRAGAPGQRTSRAQVTVIDGRGGGPWDDVDAHPSCAGIVGLADRERLRRALDRAHAAIAQHRMDGDLAGDRHHLVLVIDGLEVLRAELDDLATADLAERLDTVLAHGAPAGVTVVAGVERLGALPASVLGVFRQHLVGHLADPHDASLVGLAAADLAPAVPGRFTLAQRRLHVQLCVPAPVTVDRAADDVTAGGSTADDVTAASGSQGTVTTRLGRLASTIPLDGLPPATASVASIIVPVGQSFTALSTAELCIPDGSHVLVIGQPRSGRTTALRSIVAQWRRGALGWCGWIGGRTATQPAEVLAGMPSHGRRLLAIDDAELVEDRDGVLAALAASRSSGLVVVAAGAPEPLRRQYGHWSTAVRSARLGLLAASSTDADGDLLAATLPRQCPLTPRPGLMWLVDNGRMHLVQVASGTGEEPTA